MRRTVILVFVFVVLACQAGFAVQNPMASIGIISAAQVPQKNHPANGSWFGKAEQLCADPNAPNCFHASLFMTPTLTADGKFLGDDSLTFFPPFGPHTPAYGEWIVVNKTDVIADYVTMALASAGSASEPPAISAIRFRWQARATDASTMIGYVNIYLFPPITLTWGPLAASEFPVMPPEALAVTYPPARFVIDPATCTDPTCPLVFKFTIKRVTPKSPLGF